MPTTLQMNNCLCAFVETLSKPVIDTIVALVNSLKSILQALQAYMKLFNVDLEDQAVLLGKQLELEIEKAVIAPVRVPMTALNNLMRPFTDCAPLATMQSCMTWVTNELVEFVEKKEYDIKQLEAKIKSNQKKIEWINQLIGYFDTFTDMIQIQCPNQ